MYGKLNMSEDEYELETVREKCEELDRELNTFMQTIAELRELRDEIGMLPEKLINSESEIAVLKKELKSMMLSVTKTVDSFEKKGNGMINDLEKRIYHLEASVAYIKNNTADLQKTPLEIDKKLKVVEKRLTKYFYKNLNEQKNAILVILFLLMGSIAFSVYSFLTR